VAVDERDRTDDDDDLEFDFFDEPRTTEAPTQAEPAPKRPGGPPPVRHRSPGGNAPIMRLALLLLAAIGIAVGLVFGINSCRDDGAQGDYNQYFDSVGAVASQSTNVGRQLATLLSTPGVTLDDLESQLGGLAEQQAQVVARANDLTPPSSLLDEQGSLVESMQLRESGLRGLQQAASQIQAASDPEQAGASLGEQAARLIAGTVVYDDLFKARSEEVLKQEGVSGVAVPDSPFLADTGLITAASLSELVRRITQGGEEAGGLHGNQIAGVRVQPGGEELSPDEENTIVATEDMSIQVLVRNSGDFQEADVQVKLTLQQDPPIKKSQSIDLINSKQTKVVTFSNFTNLTFAALTTLKVSVEPVPGEENTSNNTAEYSVIFSL
jgi:CARDB protein